MEKWSLKYEVLKFFLGIGHRLFYQKIYVEGVENIPTDKPVIFAPNHQNALMDPLAIIFTTSKQHVFLARGDFFKNKWIIKIFTILKILPVYRIRDGKETLQKNVAVFSQTAKVLKHHQSFCLFPEAIHNPQRNLRPLKKGIPRIAFQTMEESNFNLDVIIIPVGIYYKNKSDSRSHLHIRYGKGIKVKDYIELYKENNQKGLLALRDAISDGIKPLILNITDKENYELLEEVRTLFNPYLIKKLQLKPNQKNLFSTDQLIVKNVQETIKQDENFLPKLKKSVNDLKGHMTILNIPNQIFKNRNSNLFSLIIQAILALIFFPFFLYGLIFNIAPYILIKNFIKKKVKDPQFYSSIKYGAGILLFPIYYFILFLVILIISTIQIAVIFLTSLPISAFLAYHYFKLYNILKIKFRYYFLKSGKKKKIEEDWQNLVNLLNPLFQNKQ